MWEIVIIVTELREQLYYAITIYAIVVSNMFV
jgi:hypothetical protein